MMHIVCLVMFTRSLLTLQESTASPLHGTSRSKVPSGLICVLASGQTKKPLEDSSSPISCKIITQFSWMTRKKVFASCTIPAEIWFNFQLHALQSFFIFVFLEDQSSFSSQAGENFSHLPVGVSLHGLSKLYGDRVAIQNLNISFYEGHVTTLLGHNGAGKTTTMYVGHSCLP